MLSPQEWQRNAQNVQKAGDKDGLIPSEAQRTQYKEGRKWRSIFNLTLDGMGVMESSALHLLHRLLCHSLSICQIKALKICQCSHFNTFVEDPRCFFSLILLYFYVGHNFVSLFLLRGKNYHVLNLIKII